MQVCAAGEKENHEHYTAFSTALCEDASREVPKDHGGPAGLRKQIGVLRSTNWPKVVGQEKSWGRGRGRLQDQGVG